MSAILNFAKVFLITSIVMFLTIMLFGCLMSFLFWEVMWLTATLKCIILWRIFAAFSFVLSLYACIYVLPELDEN